jgi:hypothetical protein
MFTLWNGKHKLCDGLTRRGFFKIGAFGGLSLADMLRARACATNTSGRAPRAAIMIYLPGGPPHLDTYDLKPNAPMEYRGEFRPIATNVPGVRICEHFPLQARIFDKLAVIRSVVSAEEHSDSLVHTGYRQLENSARHPSFGSVVSRVRGQGSGGVPPFVSLRGLTPGLEPGYLGISHRAFTLDGPGLANLRLAGGVDRERVQTRRNLLESFDVARREIDASGSMGGLDAFTGRAFEMVLSGAVRQALDLTREDPRMRERYRGVEQFLTARRLVEAGVGCVTLSFGGNGNTGNWDTHAGNFTTLRRLLPDLDRGVSSLVQDLSDRGLDQEVVTVMWGEFGRTPRINNAGSGGAGRDHWPAVMSALVAGGGLRMGQAIGASSARGEYPTHRRCTVQQVLGSLYRAMGIDPSMTFPDTSGRPMYLLEDREPIRELYDESRDSISIGKSQRGQSHGGQVLSPASAVPADSRARY